MKLYSYQETNRWYRKANVSDAGISQPPAFTAVHLFNLLTTVSSCAPVFSNPGEASSAAKKSNEEHLTFRGNTDQRFIKKQTNKKNTESGLIYDVLKKNQFQYFNPPDLYYFLLAPTLCYQRDFPCTSKVRINKLLHRLLEMVSLSSRFGIEAANTVAS